MHTCDPCVPACVLRVPGPAGTDSLGPLFPSCKNHCPGTCPRSVAGSRRLPRHLPGHTKPLRQHVEPAHGNGQGGGSPGPGLRRRVKERRGWPGSPGVRRTRVRAGSSPPQPRPRPRPPAPPTPRPDPAPPPEAAAPPLGQQGPAPPGLLGEVTSQRDGGGSFRQLKGDLGPEDPSPSAAGRGRAGSAGAGAGAAVLGLSHPPRIEALGAAGRPESDGESGAVRGAEPAARPAVAAAAAPPPRAQTQEAAGRAGASRTRRRRRHGAQSWEPVPAGPEDRQRLLRRHLSR